MNSLQLTLADLPDIGINANEWTSGCASAVGPWIAGGLGLAVVILAVVIGWRMLRRIADDIEDSNEAAFEEGYDLGRDDLLNGDGFEVGDPADDDAPYLGRADEHGPEDYENPANFAAGFEEPF